MVPSGHFGDRTSRKDTIPTIVTCDLRPRRDLCLFFRNAQQPTTGIDLKGTLGKNGMGDAPNPRKSVSFQDTVTYREICPLSEIDDEEIRNIWYSDDEYAKIKKVVTATVKKSEKGDTIDEAKGITMRGLEGRTTFGARRRKNNKKAALDAVWTTQIELWKKKMDQPLAIAAAYRPHSTHAKYRAQQAAHTDELFVNEHLRNGK